ncbi:CHAP domain-containing protein [Azospirillum oleiclasticum]|uniref:CHAP domain-containing protein n=1 Tax=Azospirillum oleiclasticum TaxID=2735135 RepID=UPI0015D4C632|nr:CHAP domain-containing protein [Azospirillum oleiclasticum]
MRVKGFAIGVAASAFLMMSPLSSAYAQLGDCVRTVRAISDFTIQGDAWMWWQRAADSYERDNRPALGSVLVFKRSPRMGRGHVSLVSALIDRRTIEVDHSWINGRGLRRGMLVSDVSPNNDWSMVRVWHEPTDQMGQRVYPTYGFILPAGQRGRGDVIEASAPAAPFSVAPTGRGAARQGRAVVAGAAESRTERGSMHRNTASAVMTMPAKAVAAVLPRRKPQAAAIAATVVAATVAEKSVVGKPAVVPAHSVAVPSRKPAPRRQLIASAAK